MSVGVQKAWSLTAGDNGSASTSTNFAENQTPASLNNSARALMAEVKGFANQILGATTTGGSANAQTYTSSSVAAIDGAYAAGMGFVFIAGYTNSGACTLNVDGVGAKDIRKGGAQAALAANDIVAGGVYFVTYHAGNDRFILLNPESGQISSQPLDATLTALAALSWSSGSPVIQFTAADTVSLTLSPTLTLVGVGAGSQSAPSLSFSGDTDTGFYNNTTDQIAVTLGGSAKWVYIGSGYVTNDQPSGYLGTGNGSVGAPSLTFVSDTDNGWWRIGANNWAGAVGGSKFIDISTTLVDFTVATRAPMAVSAETSGTLTAASSNKQVLMSADCTINDGVHAANDWIFFSNDAGTTKQIIQDTGMTLRLHGTTTTGTRTIAVRGGAAVRFNSASDATVYGDVT